MGMLTVVMLSTSGLPTDLSLRNTKLLALYADTFVLLSNMVTLSLYRYSLYKQSLKKKKKDYFSAELKLENLNQPFVIYIDINLEKKMENLQLGIFKKSPTISTSNNTLDGIVNRK